MRPGIPDRFRDTALGLSDTKKARDAVGQAPEISIIPGEPSTIPLSE